MVQPLDFSRSFLTFRIDTRAGSPRTVSHRPPFSVNNARVQIECRCRIEDDDGAAVEEYFLGASCKTERVGVDRDIWTRPNADFMPIVSTTWFVSVKTFASADTTVRLHPPSLGSQPAWHRVRAAEALDDLRIDVRTCQAVARSSAAEVVADVLDNVPLTARTVVVGDGRRATLDYPVKVVNASEREQTFQVDTGPVLLPDLARPWEEMVDGLQLAYVAFNAFDRVELIVRDRTQIGQDAFVYHYERPVRLVADTTVFRIE